MAFTETAREENFHLIDRGQFEAELAAQIDHASRTGTTGAMLMIDVGRRFDEAEVEDLSDALNSCLHDGDLLTVTGRGEFAALVQKADRHEAIAIADSLLGAIHRHVGSKTGGWRSSASIGLALESDVHPLAADHLHDAADAAMIDAQSSGHDRLAIYDSRRHDDCA
jgi:GGDEF domain-containing protein